MSCLSAVICRTDDIAGSALVKPRSDRAGGQIMAKSETPYRNILCVPVTIYGKARTEITVMKSMRYAAPLAVLAALMSLAACTDGGKGFSGRVDPDFGNPAGGGAPPAGIPPGGGWIEPRLTYQPDNGTRLFGLRISGVNLMVVFVSDEDPFGTNPDNEEQIFSYDIGQDVLRQLTFEPLGSPNNFTDFDITDNGSHVVFVSTEDIVPPSNQANSSNIFMAPTDGGAVTQVTGNTLGFLADPQIGGAGAGSVIVFYSESDLVGNNATLNREIFSINSDGSNLAQLTNVDAMPEELEFADDGSWIAYHSVSDPFGMNVDSSREIFVLDIAGVDHRQLTMGAGDSVDPSISDDGSLVAFTSRADLIPGGNADGSYEVFVANTDGTSTVQITDSDDNSGTYTSGAPGALEIAGFGNYVVFGSDADHTGDNPSQEHTIFWASTDGLTIGQPLREGYTPPTITSRAADNPHTVNDGAGLLFDSAANYSFDSTGTEEKIFTTVRE